MGIMMAGSTWPKLPSSSRSTARTLARSSVFFEGRDDVVRAPLGAGAGWATTSTHWGAFGAWPVVVEGNAGGLRRLLVWLPSSCRNDTAPSAARRVERGRLRKQDGRDARLLGGRSRTAAPTTSRPARNGNWTTSARGTAAPSARAYSASLRNLRELLARVPGLLHEAEGRATVAAEERRLSSQGLRELARARWRE